MTYPLLNDPIANRWTAFQQWDEDAQSGYVLAFRQNDSSDSSTITLRGLVQGAGYEYWDVTPSGDGPHQQLNAGTLSLWAGVDGFRLLRVQKIG